MKRQRIAHHFSVFIEGIDEPRDAWRCDHLFIDVIAITFCALLSGADSFTDIENFAQARKKWLKSWLVLKGGIPSHDTFRRVMLLIDPEKFETAFFSWANLVRKFVNEKRKSKHVCFDGKSVGGTFKASAGAKVRPLHLVNVYCPDIDLVLGQKAAKSSGFSEADAIRECLEFIDIEGTLITVDAGLSYPKLLNNIREKKGHFLVPIKKNQRYFYPELKNILESEKNHKSERAETFENKRNRSEKRTCERVDIADLEEKKTSLIRKYVPDVKSLYKVERTRTVIDRRPTVTNPPGQRDEKIFKKNEKYGTKTRMQSQVVYYVSDTKLSAARALAQIRAHWSIENKLHWGLDVSLLEDDWRVQDKRIARNLSIVRKLVYNVLRRDTSKGSLATKINKSAWDIGFLEKVIFGKTIS